MLIWDETHKAVLMSEREYNSWQETIYLLANPINAEHLRKSLAEADK
jgi:antitoxin YefM